MRNMQKLIFYISVFTMLNGCIEQGKNVENKSEIKIKNVSLCAPQTTDTSWYQAGTKAPKLNGLEGIDFKISTKNEEAQMYFNQGMMLSYGFNHAEAARSFYEATRI